MSYYDRESDARAKETAEKEEKEEIDVEDMVLMSRFTGALALKNIETRFYRKKIYSWVSSILVSVNPYRDLGLYAQRYFDLYAHDAPKNKAPHVFGVAKAAYRQLIFPVNQRKNQSILISGESGAGKTEATKLLLRYFAEQSKRQTHATANPEGDEGIEQMATIETKLLDANVVLEALGNAKTMRNDNSSRFGKWINIYFNETGKVLTGSIIKYLLEGSRVITQDSGERNYNVFYQMLAGAANKADGAQTPRAGGESKKDGGPSLASTDAEDYTYLNSSGCYTIDGVDDYEMFQKTVTAFRNLGFEPDTIRAVFSCIKGVLSLGNVSFEEGKTLKGKRSSLMTSDCLPYLKAAASALGLNDGMLRRVLTIRDMTMPGGTFLSVPRAMEDAVSIRNALATTIYHKLFDWLLKKMNEKFSTKSEGKDRKKNQNTFKMNLKDRWIGILDIFGFEAFQHNSFEQLCINFANERLQQYFVKQVFRMELALYADEKLDIKDIPYPDNSDVVALLSRKGGVFPMLKEQIGLRNGTDERFVSQLQKVHARHKKFKAPRMLPDPHFTIKHYAEDVTYNSNGFLAKNRSKLTDDVIEMMTLCQNHVAKAVFAPPPPPPATPRNRGRTPDVGRKRKKKKGAFFAAKQRNFTPEPHTLKRGRSGKKGKSTASSIAAEFQSSLSSLIKSIQETESHFIRCIKPNPEKSFKLFDHGQVMRQLSTCGIVDAVTIRKLGYTHRMQHKEFYYRYAVAMGGKPMRRGSVSKMQVDFKQESERLCREAQVLLPKEANSAKVPVWQSGITMIFYKPRVHEQLEDMLMAAQAKHAIKIQATGRMHLQRLKYFEMRDAHRALKSAMRNPNSTLELLQSYMLRCRESGVILRLLKSADAEIQARVGARDSLRAAASTSKRSIKDRLLIIRRALEGAKAVFPGQTVEQKLLSDVAMHLEQLSHTLPIELTKAYSSQEAGLEVVRLVNECVEQLKKHKDAGLVIAVKQKAEVSHALKVVKKLDDLELELTMADSSREERRLKSLLAEAKDVLGKPFRRPIIKSAMDTVECLALENRATESIRKAELDDMKSTLFDLKATLAAKPSLAKQKHHKLEGQMVKLVEKLDVARKVQSMVEHVKNVISGRGESDTKKRIESLELAVKSASGVIDEAKPFSLANTHLLASAMADVQDALHDANQDLQKEQEDKRLKEEEERRRMEAEEEARRAKAEADRLAGEKREALEREKARLEAEKRERMEREERERKQREERQLRLEAERRAEEERAKREEEELRLAKENREREEKAALEEALRLEADARQRREREAEETRLWKERLLEAEEERELEMEIAKDKLRLQETERPRKKASPRDLIQNHAPVLEKDLDTRERRYRQMRRKSSGIRSPRRRKDSEMSQLGTVEEGENDFLVSPRKDRRSGARIRISDACVSNGAESDEDVNDADDAVTLTLLRPNPKPETNESVIIL
ncbi:hypothetical protein AAMO2058_000033900 [Amorphochlora amoebiformis]